MNPCRIGACIVCVALLIGVAAPARGQTDSGDQPVSSEGYLELAEPLVDFGVVHGSAVVESTVTLHNRGEAPLTITKVFSTCGCLVAKPSDDPIQPGDSVKLTIRFDPRSRIGAYTGSVFIRTDSRRTPECQVKVTARVEPLVMVQPRTLVVDGLSPGTSKTLSVTLTSHKPLKVSVIAQKRQNPGIDIALEPLEFEVGGEPVVLRARVTAKALGYHTTKIILKCGPEDSYQHVVIPVIVRTRGPLKIEPSSLWFVRSKGQELERQTVRVLPADKDGPAPKVREIRFDSDVLQVDQEVTDFGLALRVVPNPRAFSNERTEVSSINVVLMVGERSMNASIPVYLLRTSKLSTTPSDSAPWITLTVPRIGSQGVTVLCRNRLRGNRSASWTGPPRGELELRTVTVRVEGESLRIQPRLAKDRYGLWHCLPAETGAALDPELAREVREDRREMLIVVVDRPGKSADRQLLLWHELLDMNKDITVLVLPGNPATEPYLRPAEEE